MCEGGEGRFFIIWGGQGGLFKLCGGYSFYAVRRGSIFKLCEEKWEDFFNCLGRRGFFMW